MSYLKMREVNTGRREGSEKSGSNSLFTQCRGINPLCSTVSITSMLYCIYSLILLLWVK
ncbi:unnamed protein product [Staurois parvus]|uniref:Uncharacterized protein n=1 Tax=Staurois parvus TaxID=386267 RepID=A0ABN9HAV7_9NEOB|nr:unnamed protein product [Staurois parvus]